MEKLLIMSNFPLLPQCFKETSAAEALESVYMWERVNNLYIWKYKTSKKQNLSSKYKLFKLKDTREKTNV